MAITLENARINQQLSVVQRRLNQEQARIAKEHEAETARLVQIALQQPDFAMKRLARVREQLVRVDEMMMTETDPQRMDRLASAQARLAEQERILDGRPMPGSLKPSQNKPARSRVAMPDPAPQPVVNSGPAQPSPAPAQIQPVQSPEI